MDPKTANLDPKLKEAYDRIMGTSVPTPVQNAKPQTNAQPIVSVPQPKAPQMQVHEVKPEPLNIPNTPKPPSDLPPINPVVASNEMVQSPQSPTQNEKVNSFSFKNTDAEISNKNNALLNKDSTKKKNKFMPVFLTFGGIIFFIAYAVVWAKVFNLF